MIGRQSDPLREFSQRVQNAINTQSKKIENLQNQQNQLSRRVAERNAASRGNETMDELRRHEEHYTQIVMLAGYAGFFTLWTQTKNDMSLWMFASTGALISISLITFVGFELNKSWRMGKFLSDGKRHRPDEIQQQANKINKHWHKAFVLSSSTGLLAGVSLLFWFVYTTIVAAKDLAGAT